MTEELLWGTLKELGFDSYLDRTKLSKLIMSKRQEEATQEHLIDITAALGPNRLTSMRLWRRHAGNIPTEAVVHRMPPLRYAMS